MTKKATLDHLVAKSQTRATWIASVVAAVALVVSLLSLYESHQARLATVRDELILRAKHPMGDQKINVKKMPGSMHFGAVSVPWELLLSNTGNSTVSITGYEVAESSSAAGQIMYSGIDGGILSPETKQAIELPVTLEAGKSIRLLLIIGINPGAMAYAELTEGMSESHRTLPLDTAEKLLAMKEIDIYDNPVTPIVFDGKVNGWRVEKQDKEQVFLIKFHTARGVEVSEVTSWYDLKRF